MAWRFDSKAPVSVQIENKLRLDIVNGKYKAGEQFPTVRQLAFDASVNPNTMQKALTALENEGLLITKSTSGRYVTLDQDVLEKALNAMQEEYIKRMLSEAKDLKITKKKLLDYINKEEI